MPGREEVETTPYIPVSNSDEIVDNDQAHRRLESTPEDGFFGEGGLNFADLLDILNPLQHIPLISSLYRSITGDDLSPAARKAGGILYGGTLGLLSSVANAAIESAIGKDFGGNVLAKFFDDGDGGGEVRTAESAPTHQQHHSDPVVLQSTPVIRGDHSGSHRIDASEHVVPKLSADAFRTILSSIQNEPGRDYRQGLGAGAEMWPVHRGTIRDTGLEIYRLLRPKAIQ
jgi:hypothetical protein